MYYALLVLLVMLSSYDASKGMDFPESCFLKYGKILSWVHTKLAYYTLSVTANHILLLISPHNIEELFPFPINALSLC